MYYEPLRMCLACGSGGLVPYLDLGSQPLANAFHAPGADVAAAPLGLNYCANCWHSQLTHAVKPQAMFENYSYVSGTTATLGNYFDEFADLIEADNIPTRSLKILEIGCNDGSLMQRLQKRWHRVIGVDPARNLSAESAGRNVQVIQEYWGEKVADHLLNPPGRPPLAPFDAIIAMNVLAHVRDPLEFLWQARRVLSPHGTLYVQTSQARMVERGEFDTVYHEHHSFFTVSSFLALAKQVEFRVVSIEHVPIHGTSYLFRLRPASYQDWSGPEDFIIGQQERRAGLYDPAIYRGMQDQVDTAITWTRRLVDKAKAEGMRIIGYGAAAKAMTFLNASLIRPECIIDDNPLKVGKLTPGLDIPVIGMSDFNFIADDQPILWLILAWNFRAEIKARIAAAFPNRERDQYLSYFPEIVLE